MLSLTTCPFASSLELLDLEAAGHLGMDRASELVCAGLEGGDVVRLRGDAGELVAMEDLLATRVRDREVMWRPGILVVDRDLEGLVRGCSKRCRVPGNALGLEVEGRAGLAAASGRRAAGSSRS